MRGTHQGDSSRLLFDRRKHYSGVFQQQGRVQLDSDWNAQAELVRYRRETETVDVVGPSGAPAADAGFEIEVQSCLELGPDGHFVAIGGSEACVFSEPLRPEAGWTIEARLIPRGDGVIFSRWVRHESSFQLADVLSVDGGRLRFARVGHPDLVSEPFDLTHRSHHFAVTSRVDVTTLYLDGEPVIGEASGFAAQDLERNSFLIGATIQDNQPDRQLDGLFQEFRLWSRCRSTEEIRATHDQRGEVDAASGKDLVGDWPFSENEGTRVRDHSANCNHGQVKGVPRPPRWLPYQATVSAGRYYVGGLLCENEETVAYDRQPDNPDELFPLEPPRDESAPERPRTFLFYLDVWERSVGAIEDPDLAEAALEGMDTTYRSRTLAQIKSLPISSPVEGPTTAEELPEWQAFIERTNQRGRLRARCRPAAGDTLGNDLYRIEIHHGGACLGGPRGDGDGTSQAELQGDGDLLVLDPWHDGFEAGQPVEVFGSGGEGSAWAVVTEADAEKATLRLDRSLQPAAGDGWRGPVEVRRLATYKWSRRNASTVYPIARLEEGSRQVKVSPTARGLEGMCCGNWLEIVDDLSVLRHQKAHLCQVSSVNPVQRTLTLDQTPAPRVGTDPALHPLLRIWDQSAENEAVLPQGVLLAERDWHPLEEGIELNFEGRAVYQSGDFWWLPARTELGDVQWPRDRNGESLAVEPDGVDHRYAALALLAYREDGFRVDDLRRIFPPMVTGAVSKAGDVMEGKLEIRADLEVEGDLDVRGEGRIGKIYGRLCGQDMVDTAQLVDQAVTPRKVSPEVGVVPDGYSILGPTAEAPSGYRFTGSKLTLFPDEVEWIDRLEIANVSGGPYTSATLDGKIYTLTDTGDLWVFDPVVNTSRRCSDLPARRRRFAMAAANGKLYVLGGIDASERVSHGNLTYDPRADEWREAQDMPTARCDLAVAVFDGAIHAFGGLRELPILGRYVTSRHEVYDPRLDTWVRKPPLPQAHCGMAAAASGNAIHVVGGERRWLFRLWGRIRARGHQLYHPGSDSWLAERSQLPTARRDLGLVAAGGRLFAVGGLGPSGWLADCDRYDPAVDHWLPQAPLHEPIESPGVAETEGAIYATGARRAPDAQGVLVEQFQAATVHYVHRREPGAGEPAEAEPGFELEPGPLELVEDPLPNYEGLPNFTTE